ncbi:MAG: D-alanine--D-alanine ligase, partial [Myxococcales bacterium]
MSQSNKPRVAVVFGGRSSEHSISCVSAGSVIASLDPEKYDVVPVGITRDGRWVLESADHLTIGAGGEMPEVTGTREVTLDDVGADVVFPVMHGPWGQDGTLQGQLEMTSIRYVGAGVLASAVGTDKHFMKLLFRAQGLPTQRWVLTHARDWPGERDRIHAEVAELGWPVFVKPARAGSSFGITKVDGPEGLDAAIEEAQRHDPKVIIEEAAVGARELEIGVLQTADGAPETSAIAEITVHGNHAFYDFEAKYLEESYALPAALDDSVASEMSELAKQAFVALDIEGLARVDFFAFPDGRLVI